MANSYVNELSLDAVFLLDCVIAVFTKALNIANIKQRVDLMCIAALKNQSDFRVFQFLFTVALLLQVGHLFISFLVLGRPSSSIFISSGPRPSAEFYEGWNSYLEKRLLGGCVENYRDPSKGALQVRLPPLPD